MLIFYAFFLCPFILWRPTLYNTVWLILLISCWAWKQIGCTEKNWALMLPQLLSQMPGFACWLFYLFIFFKSIHMLLNQPSLSGFMHISNKHDSTLQQTSSSKKREKKTDLQLNSGPAFSLENWLEFCTSTQLNLQLPAEQNWLISLLCPL